MMRSRIFHLRAVWFVLALGTAFPSPAQQPARPKVLGVRVGFQGRYKAGQWAPAEVVLQGGAVPVTGQVELTVPDGNGAPSRVTAPKVLLTPGQTQTVKLFARFGFDSDLRVEFRSLDDGRVKAERNFDTAIVDGEEPTGETMKAVDELILNVGPSVGVEDAFKLRPRSPDYDPAVVRLEGREPIAQLPTRWYGYEGVDAVVISTSQPEIFRQLQDARLEALDQWVQMGGRLILCLGNDAQAVLADGEPLVRFLPGKFTHKLTALRMTNAFETYVEAQDPLAAAGGGALRLQVPQFEGIDPRHVEVQEGNLPLVIRTPRGFGEVVIVAADLERRPFSTWKARGQLLNRLLRYDKSNQPEEEASGGSVVHSGITDLAGQLRGALDQFAGVTVVPFVVVAALVFGYIALIGPGDYFFVKKVLKRMELTWITFPVIVLSVSAGAYALAYHLKGNHLRLNQVDLVDIDAGGGLVRGTTWLNLFSPRTEAYDLALKPRLPAETEDEQIVLSWLGVPGSGGMDAGGAAGLFTRPYDHRPDMSSLERVPIQVWSSKALTARWRAHTSLDFASRLSAAGEDALEGSFTNDLDVPLTDCLMAYGRWVYALGTVKPGQTVTFGPGRERTELATQLTGRRLRYDSQNQQSTYYASEYDVLGFDVPAILQQMMFYQASGGRQYSGLNHRHQRFVDLSSQLTQGRAVLVGYAERADARSTARQPGAELLRDVQPVVGPADKHWTCCRIVFDVLPPVSTE